MILNVGINMTKNVGIYMTTDFAIIQLHITTNVRPRLRICDRIFERSVFSEYHDFPEFLGTPKVSDVPFLQIFISFQDSSVPPICSSFPFLPDNMDFQIPRSSRNKKHRLIFQGVV